MWEHEKEFHPEVLQDYTEYNKRMKDSYESKLKQLQDRLDDFERQKQLEIDQIRLKLTMDFEKKVIVAAKDAEIRVLQECRQDHNALTIKLAEKDTTTNTTNNANTTIVSNHIQKMNVLNLDPDHIKQKVDDHYTEQLFYRGVPGLVEFGNEHIFRDDDGNLLYVVADNARKIFKYKSERGIETDVKANKLTSAIHPHICEKIDKDIFTPDTIEKMSFYEREDYEFRLDEVRNQEKFVKCLLECNKL
ncbi:hypothetical protein OAV62_01645 [bacterium]|nr:hypothetical protein [bacterium]